MFCGSGGWKSRLAKAAGAEPSGQLSDQKLHAVVARTRFRKNTSASERFWKLSRGKNASACWREAHVKVKLIKKRNAAVAPSTFGSELDQNTAGSAHFWNLRCSKSARHCAKHISLTKANGLGPLWKLRRRKSSRHCGAKHMSKSKCNKPPHSDHFWKFTRHFLRQA